MKKTKKELTLFLMSTVYIWVYYLLAVLGNSEHPMDIYAQVMIVGSFFGLPIFMFIVIPIINGIVAGKMLQAKMTVRIISYTIISLFLLNGLFSAHMTVSNHLVKQKLFPGGDVEAVAEKHFNEIQKSAKGQINFLSYEYVEPFHSHINAGNMSGTTKPSINIRYKFVNCSSDPDCEQTHSIKYDMDTGEPIESGKPIAGILSLLKNIKWAEDFVGEYIGIKDQLRYTIFIIDHAADGPKLNFRRYDPYFNFDVLLEQTEPLYVKGTIKEATLKNKKGDNKTTGSLAGQTVEFIQKNNQVEIRVNGVHHSMLSPFER